MDNLFDASVGCEQFQVGQPGVKHVRHGACEIQGVEVYKGKLYYLIKVFETGIKLKCIGTSLTNEVPS